MERIPYEEIRRVYRSVHGLDIPASDAQALGFFACVECGLRFFCPAISADASFYERVQDLPWYYLSEKAEYEIAKRFVPAGSSVLEIGCGAGKFSAFLPAGCTYRGLEFNDAAVGKARASGLRVDRMTIEELALQGNGEYDVICCFQVLEHVTAPAAFLSAAVSLLAPAGLLLVSVPSEDSFMSEELNNVFNTPPHHLTRWTDAAMESIARLNGLALVHLEHEELSEMHVRPYAKTRFLSLLRRTGIKIPMISHFAAAYPVRALIGVVARPFEPRNRVSRQAIRGHSIVGVYRKPAGAGLPTVGGPLG